jgi:hypothetical protein
VFKEQAQKGRVEIFNANVDGVVDAVSPAKQAEQRDIPLW